MSDVTFVALLCIATHFWLLLFLQRGNVPYALAAGLCSAGALAVRQPGIFLPVAACLSMAIMAKPKPWKRVYVVAWIAFVFPSVCVLYWYYGLHGAGAINRRAMDLILELLTRPEGLLRQSGSRFMEFHLLAAFLWLPLVGATSRWARDWKGYWGLGGTLVGAGYTVLLRRKMPFQMNIIHPFGLGSTETLYGNLSPLLGQGAPYLWIFLTFASCLSLGFFCGRVHGLLKRDHPKRMIHVFLCLAGLGQLPFILLYPWVFDRSVLPMFLFYLLLLGDWMAEVPVRRTALIVLLATMVAWSLLGNREYLDWNEARWKLGGTAMREHGISPFLLDGGFEFDCTYLYEFGRAYPHIRAPQREGAPFWLNHHVPALSPVYRLAFGDQEQTGAILETPWKSLLRGREERIVLLGPSLPIFSQDPSLLVLSVPQLERKTLLRFGGVRESDLGLPYLDSLSVAAKRYRCGESPEEGIQMAARVLGRRDHGLWRWGMDLEPAAEVEDPLAFMLDSGIPETLGLFVEFPAHWNLLHVDRFAQSVQELLLSQATKRRWILLVFDGRGPVFLSPHPGTSWTQCDPRELEKDLEDLGL